MLRTDIATKRAEARLTRAQGGQSDRNRRAGAVNSKVARNSCLEQAGAGALKSGGGSMAGASQLCPSLPRLHPRRALLPTRCTVMGSGPSGRVPLDPRSATRLCAPLVGEATPRQGRAMQGVSGLFLRNVASLDKLTLILAAKNAVVVGSFSAPTTHRSFAQFHQRFSAPKQPRQ